MKLKIFLLGCLLSLSASGLFAQIYIARECAIKFFSHGMVEDLEAVNTSAKPILNTASNSVAAKVTIKAFQFEKKLMEEHFNEKYMESDKYPHAKFLGKINESVDYSKDGKHEVTITGKLDMHGVEKDRTIKGTVEIKGTEIMVNTKFNVALKDHNIEIPSLVMQNVAEVVEVSLQATLIEFKK